MTRWPGLGSMHAAHVLERDREVAGDAGHHGVGVAERHHAGGEMIAVLVDQPLAVAEQVAAAAAAARRDSRRSRRCACDSARIDDLDALAELDAGFVARLRARGPRGRPGARCRAPGARSSRRRGSPAPPRPRRRRRAWAARRSRSKTCCSAPAIGSRRARKLLRGRRPCRRSACARRRCPSRPWPPPAARARSAADRTAPG